MPTIVSAADTDAPQPVSNPDKKLHLSNEPSTIDASAAIEVVRLRTSAGVVESHDIIVGKYRLSKDAHIMSTVPTDALVWIVSVVGLKTPSWGVEGLTYDQMNFVVDANTGKLLVAYPTGWHRERVEGGPLWLQTPHLAVYFAPRTSAQLSITDLLKNHPDVAVVHTQRDLESAATTRTVIWIDKALAPVVDLSWLRGRIHERYPVVIVGYGNADYAFRQSMAESVLPGWPPSGMATPTWYRNARGYSAYMIISEKFGKSLPPSFGVVGPSSYGQSMYLRSFGTTPTVSKLRRLSVGLLKLPHR